MGRENATPSSWMGDGTPQWGMLSSVLNASRCGPALSLQVSAQWYSQLCATGTHGLSSIPQEAYSIHSTKPLTPLSRTA